MTLSDLIGLIELKNHNLPPRTVEAAVRRVFAEIIDRLAVGDRVELRGFGSLTLKDRAGDERRNPRTGERIQVANRRSVHWKTGKALHDALQKGRRD